jgi:hypothetical protein
MRITLLIYFLCQLRPFVQGQEKIFEYELEYDRRTATRSFITPLPNKSTFLLSLVYKNNINRFIIAESGKSQKLLSQSETGIKNDFPLSRKTDSKILHLYKKQTAITGFFVDNKIIDVFASFSNYLLVETDLQSGDCFISDSLKKTASEEFIYSFSKGKKIYLVTHIRNSYKILVRKKELGKEIEVDTIDTNPKKQNNDVALIFHFFKEKDLLVSEQNLWLPINALFYDHRAYVQEETLKITYNATDGSTWLASVNLENSHYRIDQFQPVLSRNEKPISNNSLLIDSLLICSYATTKSIYTSFYNTQTRELIKLDSITKESYENVASSQIVKSRNFWSGSNVESVSFENFLKATINNQLRLSGYKNGNDLHITYGTKHDRITSLTFLANLVSLGIFSFSETKGPPIISFDVYYKIPFGKAEGKRIENFVWDKILMFVWGQRNYLSNTLMFHQGNHYFIGYYNPVINKYFVHRFRENVQ